MLCILMFSTGMPILYLFASIFFFISYWGNKMLLFKFYRTTIQFNDEIALNSLIYFKVAIIIHIVVGGIMISNGNLLQADKLYDDLFSPDIFGSDNSNSNQLTIYFQRYLSTKHGKAFLVFIISLGFIITIKNFYKFIFDRVLMLCRS